MWYPIVLVLSVFLVLVIVVRRALYLGPARVDNKLYDRREEKEDDANLPNNLGTAATVEEKWDKAESLYHDKKFFAAEKWYADIVHEEPEHDKAWARLGMIALSQKRYQSAAENLERSVEINPNVPSRHYNLALAYYLLRNKDHASACIEVALKTDPEKENYLALKKKIEKLSQH